MLWNIILACAPILSLHYTTVFIIKQLKKQRYRQTESVDYSEILIHANLSKLAYYDPDKIEYSQIIEHFENKIIRFYDASKNTDQDTQAYMWKIDQTIYVCFRGSSSLYDFIADLDIELEGNLHKGFWKQFCAIEPDITEDICNFSQDIKTIIFSGHSLAGALATIAGHFYGAKYPSINIDIITFGSPRVGNSTFVKEFNRSVRKSLRIFHCEDIVAKIPMNHPYIHVGKGICISQDKGIEIEESDTNYSIRPMQAIENINIFAPFEFHSLNAYVQFFTSNAMKDALIL